jgi:hypothetical protein
VFVPFGYEFKNSVVLKIGPAHSQPLTSSPLTSTLLSCFNSPNSSRRVDIPIFPIETTAITRVSDVGCMLFHCSAERSYLATGHLLGPLKQLLGNRCSTVMRKWKQLFISGCKHDSPISMATEFLNSIKVFKKFIKAGNGGKIYRRLTRQVRRSLRYKC